MKKALLYAGIAAPVIYAATVIIGGVLWPGYNHINQAVSELIGAGAPNQQILQPLFNAYNLLLLVFGIGLFRYFKSKASKAVITGSILVIATQLLSLSWVFFPMDVPGTPATFQGTMHLVVAGLVAPLTVAIPLTFGLGFNKFPTFKNFSILSFVFAGLILVTGLTSALSVNFLPALMGLFERLTIFGYLIYVFLLAIKTFKYNPS